MKMQLWHLVGAVALLWCYVQQKTILSWKELAKTWDVLSFTLIWRHYADTFIQNGERPADCQCYKRHQKAVVEALIHCPESIWHPWYPWISAIFFFTLKRKQYPANHCVFKYRNNQNKHLITRRWRKPRWLFESWYFLPWGGCSFCFRKVYTSQPGRKAFYYFIKIDFNVICKL